MAVLILCHKVATLKKTLKFCTFKLHSIGTTALKLLCNNKNFFMYLMRLYHIGLLTLDILLHPLQLNFYATIKSFSFISEHCVTLDAF